jgi:hypothetical protein
MDVNMLTEPKVINAVCTKLEKTGYKITHKSMPNQRGVNIEARKEGQNKKLLIEAKGATSSNEESKRFGRSFDAAQIRVHVSEAFYKAAHEIPKLIVNGEDIYSCIALPATKTHLRLIQEIQHVLTRLNIILFWVDGEGNVTTNPASFLNH